MIRNFKTNDISWVRTKIEQTQDLSLNSDDHLKDSFTRDKTISLVKDDEPRGFCHLIYYDVPSGYFDFSGFRTPSG